MLFIVVEWSCDARTPFDTILLMSSSNNSRRALYKLLKQDTTYGSVLFVGLCDVWGMEWLEWEPKTVQLELYSDFGVTIDADLFDKLMAARQVVTTDSVFSELPSFIVVANALCSDGVDTPLSKPIDPGDLGFAVLEMCLLYPPTVSETFSEEIVGYMEECLRWQGIRGVPNALVNFLPEPKFAEVQASDPMIMEGIFQRLQDVNEEIIANLNAWKYQMKQLQLSNGSMEWLDERTKTAEAIIMQVTRITVTTDDEQPRDEKGRFTEEEDEPVDELLELMKGVTDAE